MTVDYDAICENFDFLASTYERLKLKKGNTFSANTIGSQIGKTTSRFVVFGINGERFIVMEDFNQKITTSIKAISANRVFIPPVAIFAVNTTYYSPFFFYKIYQAGLDKMLKSS